MARFIPLDGLRGHLTAPLKIVDTAISLDSHVAQILTENLTSVGDYTYLQISSAMSLMEIVKISYGESGFSVTRGMGITVATNHPSSACISFEMNSVAINDMIAQGGYEPPICSIEVLAPLTKTQEGCNVTIGFEWPSCEAASFLGASFSVENGCLVIEEDGCACNPSDGTYENATVTIKDGRICAIQTGPNPQYLAPSCSCCGCSSA